MIQRQIGWFAWVAVYCTGLLGGTTQLFGQGSDRTYIVNYTTTAPTIDGLLTGDAEWSMASEGGDAWTTWDTNSPDSQSNNFVALWDNSGLYVQQRVASQGWQNRGATWEGLYENINFFFDPNTDGEPNANTQLFGYSTDGYHLAINQPLGESSIQQDVTTAGTFGEYYVNNVFNSSFAATWMPQIEVSQNTSVEDASGFLELFIPWSAFDKTDPSSPGIDPLTDEVGLYHPESPKNGDEWYFNAVRVPTNGNIAVWNRAPGTIFVSERPHGLLQFAGGGEINPCDMNGDGSCDALDVDTLANAVLAGENNPLYDLNEDGSITNDDRVAYVEGMLNTWIGDSNLDGVFSSSDLVAVFTVNTYEDNIPSNAGWASGDWDGDLDFTTRDFVAAFVSGGFELGPRPAAAVSAVPEPASLWLVGAGVLSLFAYRRRAR